ncbi:hypothetical protein SCHIN_v1c04090 [Spiroplasma chinense]|uniref:BIG2 domain-containing protein n=1 Tax=Spiroplasma chinense TaxID=216932 RepID=A0A5B9Y4J6_9MOLU|nr:hypothetical protein [Spiroplasma chinense]QEH61606.1 hypothetical protein SCHIN_v1c04090 [Spiroplasma chinense]
MKKLLTLLAVSIPVSSVTTIVACDPIPFEIKINLETDVKNTELGDITLTNETTTQQKGEKVLSVAISKNSKLKNKNDWFIMTLRNDEKSAELVCKPEREEKGSCSGSVEFTFAFKTTPVISKISDITVDYGTPSTSVDIEIANPSSDGKLTVSSSNANVEATVSDLKLQLKLKDGVTATTESSITLKYPDAADVTFKVKFIGKPVISAVSDKKLEEGKETSFTVGIENQLEGSTLSATSKDDKVAEVSVKGLDVTIKAIAKGTTEITLSYKEAIDVKFSVEVVEEGTGPIQLKLEDVQNNATIKGIKDLADLDAVNAELAKAEIEGIKSLDATLKTDSKTDVTVKITTEEGYTIDKDTFDITGAIKATEPEEPEEPGDVELKLEDVQNNATIKGIKDLADLDAVNAELAKAKIVGIKSLDATLKTDSKTDVTVKITTEEGYTIDKDTFDITGAIKATEPEEPEEPGDVELKLEDVQNNATIKGIKDLADLDAVNAELAKAEIEGIKSLDATLKTDSETDVTVKITTEEGYTIDKDTFDITGAIKATEPEEPEEPGDIQLKLEDVQNNATIKGIKDLADLDAVNAELAKAEIEGIKSLDATLKTDSKTDVTVKITTEEGYTIDKDTFDITGAIKATEPEEPEEPGDVELKLEDVQNNATIKGIKDLADLDAVNAELAKVEIKGIESLDAEMSGDSTTDVVVTIKTSQGYTIDTDTFIIEGAIAVE